MKRRITAIILICAFGLSAFSCQSKVDDEAAATTATTLTDETTELIEKYLPECDYDGAEIKLLVRTERLYYLDADEVTGDTLNDRVYERNLADENRFNVGLEYIDVASDVNLFTKAVESSIMADDEGYDIICPDYWWKLDTQGYFVDLNKLDYLHFDMPWWAAGWNKNTAINGVSYTGVGYFCLDLLRNVEVVYFNKSLVDQYSLEDPYSLTNSGDWTIDKLLEMSRAVSGDANGNGIVDEDDRFGVYLNIHALHGLYHSLGAELVGKNNEGEYEISVMNERYVEINDIIYNMLNSTDTTVYSLDITVDFTTTAAYHPFSQNNLLFTMFALTAVEAMRASDIDFGIVPVPTLNAGEEYITHNYGCTLSAIPVNSPDIERSSIILEALNIESYRLIIPSYYDTVLQGKLARDDESKDMLDLIFENIEFDFGFVHSASLNNIEGVMFEGKSENMTSVYSSQEEAFKTKLDELLMTYSSLE